MTRRQLLASADSMELTQWQAWQRHLDEKEKEKTDGHTIRWADG